MTRDEALAVIKEAPLFNDTTWDFANELHEAIKVLEEQPEINVVPMTISKPEGNIVYGRDGNLYELTMSNGREHEREPALGKIRAEIEYHRRKTQSIDPYDLVGDCLDIIDKHTKESE